MRLDFIAFAAYAILLSLVDGKDFYDILGVNKRANDKEIKSAYRQLSKQYHPDKNQSPEAHDKFVEIGEAYEVLSNKEKRSNYDQYGDPDGPQHQQMDFGGGFFNQFFGGQQAQHGGKRRGDNAQLFLELSLADFYRGRDLDFDVEMSNICSKCEGTGLEDQERHKCRKCKGEGIINVTRHLGPGMIQTFRSHCDECGGKGSKITNPCTHCHAQGVRKEQRSYNVHVSGGFPRDGNQVLQGEGDEGPDIVPGDLIVVFREALKHSWGYRRIGNNLYREEVLTAKEAILGGWERVIPFFDTIDTELKISRGQNEMVSNGEVEVIKGKGMPIYSSDGLDDDKHGDLFIEYKIILPLGKEGGVQSVISDEL